VVDFDLNRQQLIILESVRQFVQGEFSCSLAVSAELDHAFPVDLWKKACDLGLVGVHYPIDYGGQGYGVLENALVVEELCRADSGLGICLALCDLGAEVILRCGSEDQRRKYLPLLASGNAISAIALTEPDHGSDITALNTKAVLEEGEWVITGSKMFISNGEQANFVVVLAQTEPCARPSHRGMSTLIVETTRPGFHAIGVGEKLGWKMSSTSQLTFEGVRVPVANIIGESGKGFYNVVQFFLESRLEIAAIAVGCAQGAFDRVLKHLAGFRQLGWHVTDSQITKHRIADMAMKIEAARMLVYRACSAFDHGHAEARLSSMAKLQAARVASEVTSLSIELLGERGVLLRNELERFHRDARILEIVEGTQEIQKNIVARSYVGSGTP
jgi:alkylation response protein AidB-like acyl-CoA dehydrogenase